MIVIVSKDKDFSQEIARHLERELGVECGFRPENAIESTDLVVTDAPGVVHETAPVVRLDLPVRLAELVADVRAKLAGAFENMEIGDYSYSARSKILLHSPSGKTTTLTDKEAELLTALAQAGQGGVGKDALLKHIWGIEADLNTHTLETHIYRLRTRIKEISGAEIIEATEGGYRVKGVMA